jgi:hypothetical protein
MAGIVGNGVLFVGLFGVERAWLSAAVMVA